MEIRNALQKIENYLTVVSNLNKTILSEGTMSRDELLLMKKYLYTSIDRIEDIERSLIIDKKEEPIEKRFEPEREIIEMKETEHIEDVEAVLSSEQQEELENMMEDIHAEASIEHTEIIEEVDYSEMISQEMEEIPAIENNMIEDTSTIEMMNENKTEDLVVEEIPVIENIIAEDAILNDIEAIVENHMEKTMPVITVGEMESSLVDNLKIESETITEVISSISEEYKPVTLVEELANRKEETSFLEQLEQQLNASPQSQLFEFFDDGKEELHETFINNKSSLEPINIGFDKPVNTSSYEQHDAVLVAEKEVETTVVEQLTPSSLNDVFKPQALIEGLTVQKSKTLSESIALNDKFIFVRELFGNQFAEYENALKHLDTLDNHIAAEQYCNNTLWDKFNWTERASIAGRFMDLIEKKFK